MLRVELEEVQQTLEEWAHVFFRTLEDRRVDFVEDASSGGDSCHRQKTDSATEAQLKLEQIAACSPNGSSCSVLEQ